MTLTRRMLIDVAVPLEAINKEAARVKSIRHGHPSTPHFWWARRPLAAARAVLFAQLVDDPALRPEAAAIADLDERSAASRARDARLRSETSPQSSSTKLDGFDDAVVRTVSENCRTIGFSRAKFEDGQ